MDEGFELPILYKGKELLLPARLLNFGFTYKIEVEVLGILLHFERDEERAWRAVMAPEEEQTDRQVDVDLLQQIVQSLETILE